VISSSEGGDESGNKKGEIIEVKVVCAVFNALGDIKKILSDSSGQNRELGSN
jgi:hypothetical protein